jgi:GNAT superfamily N-acetyltransferase
MVIRRARRDDLPALLALVAGYWKFEGLAGFDPERLGEQLALLLDAPGRGAVWIADDDRVGASTFGYLIVVYVFSLEHGGLTAEVDELFVQAAQRGRGAGSRLLAAAEAQCRRDGCTNLSLQLGSRNEAARAFYRRHGFVPRGGYELMEKPIDADDKPVVGEH